MDGNVGFFSAKGIAVNFKNKFGHVQQLKGLFFLFSRQPL
jgi:hypothetical protein